jgi:hypothetical protein
VDQIIVMAIDITSLTTSLLRAVKMECGGFHPGTGVVGGSPQAPL